MDINLEKLPSIPHTLVKLIELFNVPDVDFSQISKIIQKDPALLCKILAICNSASYAQCSFKDFEHMLVVLGIDTVKSITTTAAVQQFFSQFNTDKNIHINQFWISSLNSAFFAKEIATIISYPHPEEAYLAGLIHQIAKLVFLSQAYQEYSTILEACTSTEELKNKEIELFNISSAELGAKIIHSWGLDYMIDDAILYQDFPTHKLFDTHLIIRIINLSHNFCLQFNNLSPNNKPQFFDRAYKLFGLSQAIVEELFNRVEEKVKQACLGLEIELNTTTNNIENSDKFCLSLASQVKHIALSGSAQHGKLEFKNKQVITNLMQNIHVIFDLGCCLYFAYEPIDKKLNCTSTNSNQSNFDFSNLSISTAVDKLDKISNTSLITKAFHKNTITSSFEAGAHSISDLMIIDQQIINKLQGDGILSIPLFDNTTFHGVLVIAVSNEQYPNLLTQKALIAEFTRTATANLSQINSLEEQQKNRLDNSTQQHQLHIRKLIHEANNPLAIINNYLHILSLKIQNLDTKESQTSPANNFTQVNSQLLTLQEEVERIGHILLRMKEPAKEKSHIRESTNINDLIKDLLSVLKVSLFQTNNIQEIIKLDESIPDIKCNQNSLKQVLINLIKNSVEALSESKTNLASIEIQTNDLINMNGKQYIELIIADNGPGMDSTSLENLFSPIQTSKGENHSGLGLSICKNIIDQLGGMISCLTNSIDNKKQGVKFVILLPRNKIQKD